MTKARLGLLVLFLLASREAEAQTPRVERVVIFERGLYHAQTGKVLAGGSMGNVRSSYNARLVSRTTNVPGQVHQRFGVRYIVSGVPQGGTVELTLVTRLPPGGAEDPITGRRHFVQEYRLPVKIGTPQYRDFHFDEAWEAVPGRWALEFWYGAKKLNEQIFCVFNPENTTPAVGCDELVSMLLSK